MCIATIHLLTTVDKNKNKLQFMIQTYMWPWNKVKVIKPGMNNEGHQTWYKQSYNHAKFERPPLNSVRQKANVRFLSKQKTWQLSPLNLSKSEKQVCIHYLLTTQSDKISTEQTKNTKFSVNNRSTLLWPCNMVKVTESGTNRQSSTNSTTTQSSTFITFMVSEWIPLLKFSTSPDTGPTIMSIISFEYTPESHT